MCINNGGYNVSFSLREAIAMRLENKTSQQCKDHYFNVYIKNKGDIFPGIFTTCFLVIL